MAAGEVSELVDWDAPRAALLARAGTGAISLLEFINTRAFLTAGVPRLQENAPPRRPMPRVLGGSQGGGRFPMGQVPLMLRIFVSASVPRANMRWSYLSRAGPIVSLPAEVSRMNPDRALQVGEPKTD